MSEQDKFNLTGVWNGLYSYPQLGKSVSLIRHPDRDRQLGHRMNASAMRVGDCAGNTLYASLLGSRTSRSVLFRKTDEPAGPDYSLVEYEGTLSRQQRDLQPLGDCSACRFVPDGQVRRSVGSTNPQHPRQSLASPDAPLPTDDLLCGYGILRPNKMAATVHRHPTEDAHAGHAPRSCALAPPWRSRRWRGTHGPTLGRTVRCASCSHSARVRRSRSLGASRLILCRLHWGSRSSLKIAAARAAPSARLPSRNQSRMATHCSSTPGAFRGAGYLSQYAV